MKLFRVAVLLLTFLFILGTGATALAATEVWTTDSKTGSKICIMFFTEGMTVVSASWSGPMVEGKAEGQGMLNFVYKNKDGKEMKAQADAEMKAGKLNGVVSIKWSDGSAFDGNYREGLVEGRGVFKYADGRVYDGEFKAGQPEGYEVGKDASGKVEHDGQWKNGEPVTSRALKTDKVLGIPWGATDEQVYSILKQRPDTGYVPRFNGKDAKDRWQYYYSRFADFGESWIYVHFYQDKMWMVSISWPLSESYVMDRFNAVKKGLTERYGAPMVEKGKYLDSIVIWDLGGEGRGYTVNVQIRQNDIFLPDSRPFRVYLTYCNQSVADLMNNTSQPGGSSKDY